MAYRCMQYCWCVLALLACVSLVSSAAATDDLGVGTGNLSPDANGSSIQSFKYKVQEDPYFTFAYPFSMNISPESVDGRTTYYLTKETLPEIRYIFSSAPNDAWAVLDTDNLKEIEQRQLDSYINGFASRNLTAAEPLFEKKDNMSIFSSSYLDSGKNELIYSLVISTPDDILTGILIEPKALYKHPYGDFAVKSLFSLFPRDLSGGLNLTLVGTDTSIGEKISGTVTTSTDKDIAYDPYSGLYYDTDTGYYYLPWYGVFYDPSTGNYYYPSQFGDYTAENFVDYSGDYYTGGSEYSDYGSDTGYTGGYYDNLYSGYTDSYTGYDASDIISDSYNYRQDVYDATNAMWDDYIRGDEYYGVDSYGNLDPIDTTQEYIDYELS